MSYICTLGRNKASVCNPQAVAECDRCGWEEAEIARRKEAIKTGLTYDTETGKYALKIRKEHEHDGYDNE